MIRSLHGLLACALIIGCGEEKAPFAQPSSANAGSSARADRPRSPRDDDDEGDSDSASDPDSDPDSDSDRDASFTAHDAGVAGERDGGPRELDAGGGDAGEPSSQLPPPKLPAVTDAERSGPDARVDRSCADVPGVAGFYTPASLHVLGDLAYVFSVDASEQTPRVLMHATPVGELSFGNPATLLNGGHEVDVITDGDGARALVGRQFYTIELSSLDRFLFSEDQDVGPHQPTYNCEGYPPPRYFRGREPAELIAVGSDFNGGLFGCQERVFVAKREGLDWAEPVEVARGDVVFAHQGAARATLVTTLAVLQSTDAGATFRTVSGLDAVGGTFTGSRLILIRSGGDGARALLSDDDGGSWSAQTRVLPDQANGPALIAADGARIAIAISTASEIVLSTSADHGDRWTEPARIPRPSHRRLLAIAQRGDTTLWLTSGVEGALELCALR